jgi:hypothetical protein
MPIPAALRPLGAIASDWMAPRVHRTPENAVNERNRLWVLKKCVTGTWFGCEHDAR